MIYETETDLCFTVIQDVAPRTEPSVDGYYNVQT